MIGRSCLCAGRLDLQPVEAPVVLSPHAVAAAGAATLRGGASSGGGAGTSARPVSASGDRRTKATLEDGHLQRHRHTVQPTSLQPPATNMRLTAAPARLTASYSSIIPLSNGLCTTPTHQRRNRRHTWWLVSAAARRARRQHAHCRRVQQCACLRPRAAAGAPPCAGRAVHWNTAAAPASILQMSIQLCGLFAVDTH